MKDPIIRSHFLSENPEAARYHSLGLQAQLDGNYDDAHENLAAAAAIVGELDARTSLSSQVQWARIMRDTGFTYVRQATRDKSSKLLTAGDAIFDLSLGETKTTMLGAEFKELTSAEQEGSAVASEVKRAVMAEHGATLGVSARSGTVRLVLFPNEASNPLYKEAHDVLRQGNNGYYLVSNAMNAARDQTLRSSRYRDASLWLGRAASGVAWTALHDQQNLKPASGTFGRRFLDAVDGPHMARESVLTRP